MMVAHQLTSWSVWDVSDMASEVMLDCLMPTGILIPLRVCRDLTLEQVKEKLWEASQKYPLYSLLKARYTYNFMSINHMAAKEELMDETKTINEVKPFQLFLKVVTKTPNKAETVINNNISHLIGVGLKDFDVLKTGEVPEFRGRMKQMCKQIGKERDSKSWYERALIQYPPDLGNDPELLPHLQDKLHEGNFCVRVDVENDCESKYFKILVPTMAYPEEVVLKVLHKIASTTGCEYREEEKKNYFLKVAGCEEYLLGTHMLSQFNYMRIKLSKEEVPHLVLVNKEQLLQWAPPTIPPPRVNGLPRPVPKPQAHESTVVTTWDVRDQYTVTISDVSNVDYNEFSKLFMRVGIYQGDEIMCSPQNSKHTQLDADKCASWDDEILTFDLELCDIPRMARLCFLLCAVDKRKKGGQGTMGRRIKEGDQEVVPLAWLNFTIFDYKDRLRSGQQVVHMWPITDDSLLSEELLNPIGLVESNPSVEESTCLNLEFHDPGGKLYFPPMQRVLALAFETLDCASNLSMPIDGPATLAERLDSVTFDDNKVTKAHLEPLRVMIDRDPLHALHEQEKELIWKLKLECRRDFPHSLPKLLKCVQWNNHGCVAQMQALLTAWTTLPATAALELLDFTYADREVRKFAVKCLQNITDHDLCQYLIQLVQVLKYEAYLDNELVCFLLRRALYNQRIGHFFFWLLRSEMHVPSLSVRFGVILEAYCRGNTAHISILSKQLDSLKKLKVVSNSLKNQNRALKEENKRAMKKTLNLPAFQAPLSDVCCALNPSYRLKTLKVEECKYMDSKMRPLWLVWENDDHRGSDINVMYKYGDDLRQDMLTLQIIRIMDNMWKEEGLDLSINAYNCLSTGHREGLIEIVLQADTIANIQKAESKHRLKAGFERECLYKHLNNKCDDPVQLNKAIEEFTRSCAGYCVATYVLGIGDRHSDNIMLKQNGQLFHIDFGHILGHFKSMMGVKRERVPFVLTPDFVYVIKGGPANDAAAYERFCEYCERAYLILHRRSSFLITLFLMMMNTGLPEVSSIKDIEYLKETLKPDFSEREALLHFKIKFREALKNSMSAQLNFLFHNWVKDNT